MKKVLKYVLYVFIGLRDRRKREYLASLPLEPDTTRAPEGADRRAS